LQRCLGAESLLLAAASEKVVSVRTTAMLQGAVFHLYAAYLLHLREIAANYAYTDAQEISTIQQLVDVLGKQDKVAAEGSEMARLIEDRNSWLAKCLTAYWQCLDGPVGQTVQISHAGIDLRQENLPESTPAIGDVETWLAAMLELFDRHRALMYEY